MQVGGLERGRNGAGTTYARMERAADIVVGGWDAGAYG